MILNKNRLAYTLSPAGKEETKRKVEKLKADIRQLLRDQDITGMTPDMVDSALNTGCVLSAFYEVMFETEIETRLYMGASVEQAIVGTVKALMDRGSDVMAVEADKTEHYQNLKEQLEKNRHGG